MRIKAGGRRSFRYKLSLEEVADLSKTIHTTLRIQEDKVDLFLHDEMFEGRGEVT